jgi:hypothetical protein
LNKKIPAICKNAAMNDFSVGDTSSPAAGLTDWPKLEVIQVVQPVAQRCAGNLPNYDHEQFGSTKLCPPNFGRLNQ